MKVTRDVIYDLLPAYFAGDVSADTRALIDEFFAGDPEFGRMAERFRSLLTERLRSAPETEAEREKNVFDRAKARVNLRLAAVVWGLGAAFALAMAMFTGRGRPGVVIGVVFVAMSLGTALLSWAPRPEYWYALMTDGASGKSRK